MRTVVNKIHVYKLTLFMVVTGKYISLSVTAYLRISMKNGIVIL